jgi:ribulose-phosphate 3-epimerase
MSASRGVHIAPSILSADFSRLGDEVREVEAGGADFLHVDVMDGHFVPNLTVGPLVVEALRPVTRLPIHVHLMVERPEQLIPDFVRAGADLVTVHVETCPHLHRTLQQIRELGALASVTLNPATPLSTLEEVLAEVALILVMTVNPGFGGQSMVPSSLSKVRRLRQMLEQRGLSPLVEVDGGVNAATMAEIVAAGADTLVMGSAIFGAPDGPRAAVERFRALLRK